LRNDQAGSFLSSYLYKGEPEGGVFESRRSVWDQTLTSIRQQPWFGTGFGTVSTSYDATIPQAGTFASSHSTTREHGNSYLAITEWVGLLGVTPFLLLVILIGSKAGQVMVWLRRTGDPYSPAVPIAAVIVAGLVHATFEDWMFAVGYYMCVFFWSLGFMLVDVAPARERWMARPSVSVVPVPWPSNPGVATPGR
jgi:O-antigen ligase